MWRHGCPTSPEWFSSCSASDTSCGGEEYEHNNKCRAIEVIGQDWPSEVVALFLEDWELGRVALSCHLAMDLLCQEIRDACWVGSKSLGALVHCVHSAREVLLWNCHSSKALLSPWTGCDNIGEARG